MDMNHPDLRSPKLEPAGPAHRMLSYGTTDQPFAQTMAEFKFHLLKHTQAQEEEQTLHCPRGGVDCQGIADGP